MTQSFAYPRSETKIQPEQADETVIPIEDEVDWYKPVALILKPASERDLQKRFQMARAEEDGSFSLDSHYKYHKTANSFRPSFQDPYWEFNQREPFQQAREEDGDRLRDYYQSYGVPEQTQGNLLSLARLGLVAIPRREVEAQYSTKGGHGIKSMKR